MNRERLTLLLESYRDGTIDPADAAELATIIDDGGADGAWAVAHLALMGQIAQARDDTDDEVFVASLRERMRAEANGSAFVRSVAQRRARQSSGSARRRPAVRRSRRFAAPIAAAALCALLVGVAAVTLAGRRSLHAEATVRCASVVEVSGQAVVERGGSTAPLVPGGPLDVGDHLRLTAGSRLAWRYDDGTLANSVGPADLAIPVGDPDTGKRIRLDAGVIRAHVAPQPTGRPLRILTPAATCEVVGTDLSVEVGAAATRLTVQQGHVRMSSVADGSAVEVGAGRYAEVGDGIALAVHDLRPDPQPVPVQARVARSVDDHEGELRWTHDPLSAPLGFAISDLRPHAGRSSLRIDFHRDTSDARPFAQILHPLYPKPGDRALSMWLLVESAQPDAKWQIQAHDGDNRFWTLWIGTAADTKPGWNEIVIPFTARPGLAYAPRGHDAQPFRLDQVNAVALNLYGGDALIDIDDLGLLDEP